MSLRLRRAPFAGIPTMIAMLAVVLVLLFVIYGAATFSGPYRFFAEAETRLSGSWHPGLAFLLALLSTGCVVFVLLLVAVRTRLIARVETTESEVERAARAERKHVVWADRKLWLVSGAGGCLLFILGIRDLTTLWSSREVVRISVDELERGKRPDGAWLEITGRLSENHATDYGTTPNQTFVPLISSGWRGPAIAAVLKIPAGMQTAGNSFRGMADGEGVPSPIRQVWVEAGIDTSGAIVLDLGADPTSRRTHMAWTFGCSLVLLAFAAGAFVFKRRKNAALGH